MAAYESMAVRHNALGLTAPVNPRVRPFHDRPFRVLDAGRFADALTAGITDPELRGRPRTGAIDQFVLAGAGAVLILRGDTVLGAMAVSGGAAPGQDDECAGAGLAVLVP
jgi:hypothetical protein